MRTRTIMIVPGVVAANNDITIPGDARVGALKAAGKNLLTEGTPNTVVRTALTVKKYDPALAGGEVAVKDKNTLRCGTALTASDFLDVTYYSMDDVPGLKDNYA